MSHHNKNDCLKWSVEQKKLIKANNDNIYSNRTVEQLYKVPTTTATTSGNHNNKKYNKLERQMQFENNDSFIHIKRNFYI